jgi:glucan phosphoethanolaminetransferase (alkaline phosphatase superfamily)
MAFPDLAVNLIYTVLCLVPGFISLQTVTYAANLDTEMGEFEKSTWSLLGSGISLSVLYFLYVVWMGVMTGRFVLIRSLDISWVELVVVYPILLFVAVLVGYVSAKILIRTRGTPTRTALETGQ